MESISLSWKPHGTFHHVGFVVASIQDCAEAMANNLSAKWDGQIIEDPNQAAKVTFLQSERPSDPLFELVEPYGEKSHLHTFLKRGGGFHHICYEVADLQNQLKISREQGSLVVRDPMPAEAFGGRKIAWVYTKQKLLIEYLER